MKFERNSNYTSIAIYALLVMICAIVFNEAFKNIGVVKDWFLTVAGYIQPIINGLVFAFLLNPLLRFTEKKLLGSPRLALSPGQKRGLGVAITYLFALILSALFIALIMPQLFLSVQSILNNLQTYFKMMQNVYNTLTDFIAGFSTDTEFEKLVTGLLYRLLDSLQNLVAGASEYLSMFLFGLISATQRITAGIVNLLLGVIVSIYLLMDSEKMLAQLKKTVRAFSSDRVYHLLCDIAIDSNRILSGFVLGKIIDSFIIGILCFVGMSILRLPFAVLISVIVGVTNVIPYFGPFIGAIPSAVIIAVSSPAQALWFILFILVLQQFDGNILGPKILGDSIGLSAFWVITSIMLFSGLLGVAGMFIGVPLFAIIYTLMGRLVRFLLERKGESTDTKDYASENNPLIK